MKKILVYIFLIFFSLSNTSYSEDIRNLQIEGMSVGDDVTEYFSSGTLESWLKTKEIREVESSKYSYGTAEAEISPLKLFKTTVSSNQFETYDSVTVIYYENIIEVGQQSIIDQQRIKSITGLIYYKNNFEKCKVNKKEAVRDISKILDDKFELKEYGERSDGGTKIVESVFFLDSGGGIGVSCYDYKKSLELIGAKDALMVTISADLKLINKSEPLLKTNADSKSINAKFIQIKPQQREIERPKF